MKFCATHNDLGLIHSFKKLGFYVIAIGEIKNLLSANNSASSVSEDSELTIEVARLDDTFNEGIDFIKMDIEDSEGVAIEGAR